LQRVGVATVLIVHLIPGVLLKASETIAGFVRSLPDRLSTTTRGLSSTAAATASVPDRIWSGLATMPTQLRRVVRREPSRSLALSVGAGFLLGLILRRTVFARR
jgi:hypothetical protein